MTWGATGGFDVCVACARAHGQVSDDEHAALYALAHSFLASAPSTASALPSGQFEKRRLEQSADGTWGEIAPLKPAQSLDLPASHHLLTGTTTTSQNLSFFSATDQAGRRMHAWDVSYCCWQAGMRGRQCSAATASCLPQMALNQGYAFSAGWMMISIGLGDAHALSTRHP